jgi:hypothetical protein
MPLPFWCLNTSEGFDGSLYAKNPDELVVLDGKKLPGVATVKAAPTQQFDLQKINGGDGASVVLRGYLPGPIEIEVVIWTIEQWERWQEIFPAIWRKPGKLATKSVGSGKKEKAAAKVAARAGAVAAQQAALTIYHPYLSQFGITRVVVTGISLPEKGPAEQSRVIRIKCMEYTPVPPGKQATARVHGTAPPEVPIDTHFREREDVANSPKTPPGAADGER